jgi:hypothetical protein
MRYACIIEFWALGNKAVSLIKPNRMHLGVQIGLTLIAMICRRNKARKSIAAKASASIRRQLGQCARRETAGPWPLPGHRLRSARECSPHPGHPVLKLRAPVVPEQRL